jgi:hypothetical protein
MWLFLKHYDGAQPGKYHVFNAVTNSELIELDPVFTIRPAYPTSVKKVHTIQKCLADMGNSITQMTIL